MQCSKLGTVRDTNKIYLQQKEYERGMSKMVYKRVWGLGLGAELPCIIEHFHLPALFLSLYFSVTYFSVYE